jgi:hypothetical protein
VVVALAATALVIAATTSGAVTLVDKVTICHRTNSDTNPYVVITPDVFGVLDGHAKKHDDPFIWGPTLKASHQKWGDIIPPFDYLDKDGVQQHFAGLNWTTVGGPGGAWTGQEVWENDCSFEEDPPAPPATGSIDLTKVVSNTEGATGVPDTFTIHVTCPDSAIDQDVVFGPSGDLPVGDTFTLDGLLTGDTCTISEDTTVLPAGTAVHFSVDGAVTTPVPASVDVEVPDDDTAAVIVDNDFAEVGGEVVVTPTDPGTPAPTEAPTVAPAAVVAAPVFTG